MKDLNDEIARLDKSMLHEFRIDDVSLKGDRADFLLTIIASQENNVLSTWRVVCENCLGVMINRCETPRDYRFKFGLLMIGKSSVKGAYFHATRVDDHTAT
ncbi:hypothetical protein LRP52_40080 [Photobacterium sp. ZSDE20]|nr:hypothetical protein [Photobacterium sp. ZSDE20]